MKVNAFFAAVAFVATHAAFAAVPYKADFEQATGTGPVFGVNTSAADYYDTTRGSIDYPFVTVVDNPTRQGNRSGRTYLCDSTGATGSCPYSSREISRNVEKRSIDIRLESPSIFPYGEVRWVALSILLPTTNQFRVGDNGDYSGMIFQIMTDIDSLFIPSFAVYARSADFRYSASAVGANGFGQKTLGVWHDFLIGYKPHCTDGSGYVQINHRETPIGGTAPAWTTIVTSTNRSVTIDMCNRALPSRTGEIDFSWGTLLYRAGDINGTNSMYFDGPWVATTQAEAEAFFEDQTETQIATPGSLDIAWGDGTASAIWAQTGESNVDDWTAQQCWDDRPCVESTVATKTVEIAEPWGKSLVLRVRGNGKSGYADSEWGSLTEARAYPEAVTNVRMVGAQVAATEITSSSTITLSTIGATDWVHYGLAAATDVNRKSGASVQIGAMTHVQASAGRVVGADTRPPIAWAGGTPTATEAGTRAYLAHGWSSALQGSGFSLSAPAASTARSLHLYLVTVKAPATLTATLNGAITTTTIGTAGVVQHWDVGIVYSGSGLLNLTWLKTDTGTDTRVGIVGARLE